MNISEATSKLNELGLNIRVSGSGSAILQDPAMNTVVEQGTVVTVKIIWCYVIIEYFERQNIQLLQITNINLCIYL